MLDEIEELRLRRRLERWVDQEFLAEAKSDAKTGTVGEGEQITSAVTVEMKFSEDDFRTLIIQFRALGLIEKSERNRSVKDKATYWTLTPYGDERLTTLRAIRRGGSE